MKPRRKRSKRARTIRLWKKTEAFKAVPYLRSIIGSLREHWLEVLTAERQIDLATQLKKPVKRQQLLEQEKQGDELHRAREKFNDALDELNRLDVFLLEPVRGLALMPFRKQDDLAWYIVDQFAPSGLIGWRKNDDPIEECRPLELLDDAAVGQPA